MAGDVIRAGEIDELLASVVDCVRRQDEVDVAAAGDGGALVDVDVCLTR